VSEDLTVTDISMRRRIASGGLKVPRSNRSNRSNRTQASYNAAENGVYGEGAKFGTFTGPTRENGDSFTGLPGLWARSQRV